METCILVFHFQQHDSSFDSQKVADKMCYPQLKLGTVQGFHTL